MKKRKILLSLCAVMALVGCGPNSDYEAESNIIGENEVEETQEEYVDNGGLSGRVISSIYEQGSKVCFDLNVDGLCNDSEPSVQTYEEGRYSFTSAVTDLYTDEILLAEVKAADISYILSANQSNVSDKTLNITPFTALLVNEQTYNPYTINDKAASISYLTTNLSGMEESILTGDDYISSDNTNVISNASNLVDALTQVYALNTTSPYLGIATVIDEVVSNDSFSVSIDSLNVQENFINNLSLTDDNQSVSWDMLYNDETTLGSSYSSNKNKVVVNSMWNNKLTVLDTSDTTSIATVRDNQQFLYIDGGKDAQDSTGATEQELEKVLLSSDGNTAYSLMLEAKSSEGTGIYKTDITSSVPDISYGTVAEGNNYYSDSEITDIALSSDDSILVASSNDKEILIFNTSDLSSPTTIITTSYKARVIEISEDNKYIFVGLYDRSSPSLSIYDATSGELLSELITSETPNHICIKDENELFFSLEDEAMIRNIDITNKSSIVEKDSIATSSSISNLNILSDDSNDYLISSSSTQVNVYDTSNTSNVATLNLSESVDNAFSINGKKIAIVHDLSMEYFTLEVSQTGTISDEAKTTWSTTHR